jgi:5-methylcytosine-specific restriction protein A
MPERALHPCAKHGCAGLTRQRYCDAHAHLQREYETASLDRLREIRKPPEVSALYASPTWTLMRMWQLSHAPLCEECKKQGWAVAATDVDHIRPHRGDRALFFDPNGLQSLCKKSHHRKTMQETHRKRSE